VTTPTATAQVAARPTLLTPTFLALAAASLAYFAAVGALIPALPRVVAGPLGGGDVAVGAVVGAFSVTAVLLRPVAGILVDRRGRRPLLLAGAAVFAVSVLGYGLATTPATLAGMRLLSGAGEAMFFVGMVTAFADLAPEDRRGEAMSLASLALYLGIGIGPLVSEAVLARAGFAAVWATTAAVAGLAVVLLTRVPETRPRVQATAPTTATSERTRLVHRAGLLPGLLLLTTITAMAGFLTFLPLHVRTVGVTSAGPLLLVFSATVVILRSAGARLPDRLGPTRTIRAAAVASTVGLVAVGTATGGAGLAVGTALFGVGVALLTPSVFALAVSRAPAEERGQVLATTSAFIDVAFGLGPVVLGIVASRFGREAVFLTGAALAATALPLLGLRCSRAGR
jgi:MFS family permease